MEKKLSKSTGNILIRLDGSKNDRHKKRRPIPKERLSILSQYFGIDEGLLVDEKNFTRNINPVSKIDIQMILLNKMIEEGKEDVEPYREKLQKLQGERVKQIRIARLASILNQENPEINRIIDAVLDRVESGNLDKLQQLV
ncbi:hypothetical protein [Bacillus sp. T33-2]|uniref:hypothetical protein n=1 Tax=Bacillus sp. T33-2 TaxID=2054168 RepID=UPI000C780954|nr:hypothetical protein [Bacillus sp. T33-2]PLR96933.1 hypothetical protein CVD19_10120 [Bacillus sp. T33-2]